MAPALNAAVKDATRWLRSLDRRAVRPEADGVAVLKAFDEELAARGEPAGTVVRTLAERISVCNWRTDEDDVDRSVDAILNAHRLAAGR